MRVWRLCSSRHPAPDGEGARLSGGRWNFPGSAVVYASATLSLAVLEKLVQVDWDLLPKDLITFSAEIPDRVEIETIHEATLPSSWRDYPAPEAIQALGTAWVNRAETAVLSVPSVVIPEERNYLLNPARSDFRRIRWAEPRPFVWDPRLIE